MADEDMPLADLIRDFINCVVMYKNSPVYILAVSPRKLVKMQHLISQKIEEVPFKLDLFNAPTRRIGFVNSGLSCVYISRIPVRKYFMGLSKYNVEVMSLAEYDDANNYRQFVNECGGLKSTAVGNALLNIYPSFTEVMKTLAEFKGVIAFDKQFAVSHTKRVYYKSSYVGDVKRNAKTIDDIVWKAGNHHLILLLGKNYEKAIRVTRNKA
jgi:hypothetical protein